MSTKRNQTPAVELLNHHFSYDPVTGHLVWKVPTANRVKAGDIVGSPMPKGYLRTAFKGKGYLVHCLVWKMAYGADPEPGFDIHHGPGGPGDNRLENLSLITHRANCSIERTTKSGLPVGVCRHRGRHMASIKMNGKAKTLGVFDTPEQASNAYQEMLRKINP